MSSRGSPMRSLDANPAPRIVIHPNRPAVPFWRRILTTIFTNRPLVPVWRKFLGILKRWATFQPTFQIPNADPVDPPARPPLHRRLNRLGGVPFRFVFLKVSDSAFWFLVCILKFILHILAFNGTNFYQKKFKGGKSLWGWAVLACVFFIWLVIYFKKIHRWRLKATWLQLDFPWPVKMLGLPLLILCNGWYNVLPEAEFAFPMMLLLLIFLATAHILVLRPSSDLNVINGLLTALVVYGIKIRKNLPPYGLFAIVASCLFLGAFKFYFEAMVKEFSVPPAALGDGNDNDADNGPRPANEGDAGARER
ncbi:unnamed protein product [Linum trigynum]|uniref:Uncharacterized protein n=1 Tax=Linum trigynum TaxID=586398 RepID=A0AAV2CGB8_9ROSI